MRFITYLDGSNIKVGSMCTATTFADATAEVGGSLRQFLEKSDADRLRAVDRIRALPAQHRIGEVALLSVIPDPSVIWALALNYATHIAEGPHSRPPYPVMFIRVASSFVGHDVDLVKPSNAERFDYEGELAVVIGKAGRHIAAADAGEYVAGYTCCNEGSVRDWQLHSSQITPGKNFFASGSLGPWLVTPDEISDIGAQTLTTHVNGEERQRALLSEMIFSIGDIIEYISSFAPIAPGDVILTGTPGGVGHRHDPPLLLDHGDVVVVEISGVGRLSNRVASEVRTA